MPRGRVLWFAAAFVLIAAVVALAFVAPPFAVTRMLAVVSSEWLVTGPLDQDGRVTAAAKRLLGAYVQVSLASNLADRIAEDTKSEEEFLMQAMTVVRDKVLNQSQFDHIPRPWQVLVAGAGFCNQINGSVAMIAAHRFEVSQVWGLYEAERQLSPHAVGRVWSSTRRDWIYFDAFYDVPVMYTRQADGTVRYLDVPQPPAVAKRTAPKREYYALPGWIMVEMRPTFAGFVMARSGAVSPTTVARTTTGARTTTVAATATMIETVVPALADPTIGTLPPRQKLDDRVFERISSEYVKVRLDDLAGRDCRAAYLRIARDPEAATDERAAELATIASRFAAEHGSLTD